MNACVQFVASFFIQPRTPANGKNLHTLRVCLSTTVNQEKKICNRHGWGLISIVIQTSSGLPR